MDGAAPPHADLELPAAEGSRVALRVGVEAWRRWRWASSPAGWLRARRTAWPGIAWATKWRASASSSGSFIWIVRIIWIAWRATSAERQVGVLPVLVLLEVVGIRLVASGRVVVEEVELSGGSPLRRQPDDSLASCRSGRGGRLGRWWLGVGAGATSVCSRSRGCRLRQSRRRTRSSRLGRSGRRRTRSSRRTKKLSAYSQ